MCSKVVESCVVKQLKPGVPKVSALVSANFEVYFTTQLFKYLTKLLFTTQVSVLVSTKRPGGIDAILHSLARQTNQDFELVQIAQQTKKLSPLKEPSAPDKPSLRAGMILFIICLFACLLVLFICTPQHSAADILETL